MVGVLIELKDLKRLIQFGLIGFYILGFYLEVFHNHRFFTYMVRDHSTSTLIVTFLTGISFLGWIVPKPKRKIEGGGEVAMKRFHAVIVLVVAVLVTLVVALANYTEETKAWMGNVGGGVGASIVAGFSGFNNALRAYEPYQIMIGSIIGGILLTVVLVNTLIPKVQKRLHPATVHRTPYQGEPEPAPAVKIRPTTVPRQETVVQEDAKAEQSA